MSQKSTKDHNIYKPRVQCHRKSEAKFSHVHEYAREEKLNKCLKIEKRKITGQNKVVEGPFFGINEAQGPTAMILSTMWTRILEKVLLTALLLDIGKMFNKSVPWSDKFGENHSFYLSTPHTIQYSLVKTQINTHFFKTCITFPYFCDYWTLTRILTNNM